jgi:hypothetical protein
MELELDYSEAMRRRALAAARLADCCLRWDLPHAALVTARAAARAALLTLAGAQRHPTGPDAELLVGLASLSLGDSEVRSDTRKILADAGLKAIDRLLGPVWQSAIRQDEGGASHATGAHMLLGASPRGSTNDSRNMAHRA